MRLDQLKRRDFIKSIGALTLWSPAARAQQSKLPTIGFLGADTPLVDTQRLAAFVQRLRELHWIEGRTVAIEARWAEGRAERVAEIAAEFVRLKVDVIGERASAGSHRPSFSRVSGWAGLVEHRHVRLDAVLMHQPAEHLSGAIGAVAHKPSGIQIEADIVAPKFKRDTRNDCFAAHQPEIRYRDRSGWRHRSFDHALCRQDFGLADRGGRFDIDNDRVVDIDQIVGGVSKERLPAVRSSPACRWIGRRDELGHDLGRSSESCIVKARQDGTFSRDDFTYDHARDLYLCPGGKKLTTTGTLVNDHATMLYRASKHDCAECALKLKCCPNTPTRKVPRSIYESARDMARQIAKSWEGRTSRRLRKKVEMLFAHLKRILKLDRLRLRGPNGARDEFLLAATAQNLSWRN